MLVASTLAASLPSARAASSDDQAKGLLPGLPLTLTVSVGANRAIVAIDSGLLPLAVDAELILAFDDARNLCEGTLGLGAALVDPLDPAFRARLPESALVPLALPLVIQVEPPANASCAPGGGPLEFSDTVRAEIHTHLLPFTIDSPLRLYKAPLGGHFRDITDGVAPGSVRTGGRTGGFSEFLVVVDLTPPIEAARTKYGELASRLTHPAIDPALRSALQADLADSRTAYDLGDYTAAIFAIDTFVARVRASSGAQIPDRWRARRDLENVAGELLGEAASLEFVLGRL